MLNTLVIAAEQAQSTRILVVEDESIIAADMQDCLENLGYSVVAIAASGTEAIEQANELNPDLVLMDIRLKGDMDGIQAAEQIWSRFKIPIVYATGFSDRHTLERAQLTRPFGYILKPVEERELYAAVETALQQYRANCELQDREQWLTTILRDIGDGVIVVDLQNRIRLMNLVAEAMTGWTQQEAASRPISEIFNLIYAETGAPLPNPTAEALERGTLVYLPEGSMLVSKTGIRVPIADTATPVRDESGAISGAVLVFRDITRRRLLEERDLAIRKAQQLETQMLELQRINRLKDDFLNTVSHELRTPLSNMKMAIEMLEVTLNQQEMIQNSQSTADRTVRYLEILRDQCNYELKLVNDLLDLQRLNADNYIISSSSIQLQDWIPHIAESFQERMQQQEQALQIQIPADLPALISDLSSVTRIVAELFNNACKYTPPRGTVTVTVQRLERLEQSDAELDQANQHSEPTPASTEILPFAETRVVMQIKVCNSGVEIPAQELPRIFEQFYRIPNPNVHHQGGTGLGLALVKKLVNYLRGAIQAESSNGWTCFTVELPEI